MMIQRKIETLSQDEDERQDLWVAYLEDPYFDLSSRFIEIKSRNDANDIILSNLINYLQSPPTSEMLELLDNFTELERSVMILLVIGFTKEQVSKYKMIEMLRLQQMINNISTHPIWEKTLAKKETER
jgi:hypothetical protein